MDVQKESKSSGSRAKWVGKEVIEEIRKWSFGLGIRAGLDIHELADLQNDMAVVVYQKIADRKLRRDRKGRWRGFICGVGKRTCLARVRRKAMWWKRFKSDDRNAEPPPANNDQSHVLEERELVEVLLRGVDQLGQKDRQIVRMRFWEEKTLEQIADEERISVGCAHMRLKKAINTLRRMVA